MEFMAVEAAAVTPPVEMPPTLRHRCLTFAYGTSRQRIAKTAKDLEIIFLICLKYGLNTRRKISKQYSHQIGIDE